MVLVLVLKQFASLFWDILIFAGLVRASISLEMVSNSAASFQAFFYDKKSRSASAGRSDAERIKRTPERMEFRKDPC